MAEPTTKNFLLIRRREARGWGQKQLALRMREAAERRGISLAGTRTLISEICRWENGRAVPNGLHRLLLREVLAAETDAELGFASSQGDGIVWDPMHRRRFLAHLAALSSTAMLAPFGVFQAPQRSERLQKVLDGQVRVDDASITELAIRVDSLRRLDKRFGARRVYPLVLEQLEELRTIEKAGISAELLPGLLGVTAEATMLAGWQLLDLQMLPESGEYYRLAVAAAHAAGDRMLEGYALADSAHVLVTAGLTKHASSTLEHAARLVDEGGHRQLRSWLASMQADTSGRAGDERGVKDALDRAERALAKESFELAPLYISDFDIAHLQRWRGRGLLHLRQNSPAQTALEEAVRLEYEADLRGKAASLAELAKAYAADREIDQAAEAAIEALRLARETNSLRNEQRVHEVRRMLEPWSDHPAVVELDEHLHANH